MKKLFILSLALLAVSSVWAGKIVTSSIQSKVLGAERKFNVYLPDGYDRQTDRTYPVLYLLHGLGDDHTAWDQKGRLVDVLDELIRSGEAVPMVVVMPSARKDDNKAVDGYFNVPDWPYEDFFFNEFMPYVEQQYRIQGDKAHRAISGLSMGGGGSVAYAQKHPEKFAACYAFSAWLDQHIDEKTAASTDRKTFTSKGVHDNSGIEFVKKASQETRDQLRTVKWFLDCGDDDFLLELNMDFYREMRHARIPAEFRVRDGIHNWEYWHTGLRMSLPFVSRNFAK